MTKETLGTFVYDAITADKATFYNWQAENIRNDVYDGKNWLRLTVNGATYRGDVLVSFNENTNFFQARFLSADNATVKKILYAIEPQYLVETLNSVIEKDVRDKDARNPKRKKRDILARLNDIL